MSHCTKPHPLAVTFSNNLNSLKIDSPKEILDTYSFAYFTGVLRIFGLIKNDITQSDTASKHAWWFLIPSITLAIYYSYKITFAHDKKSVFWRNLVSAIAFSVFLSLLLVKSFQGYLYIYNCTMGNQKTVLLKGFVNYREKPRRLGRLFSQYKLTVTLDSTNQKIIITAKSDKYEAGKRIELEVKKGSLGYLYR